MSDDGFPQRSEALFSEHKNAAGELQAAQDIYNGVDSAPTHTPADKETAVDLHQEARSNYDQNLAEAKKAVSETDMVGQAAEIKKLLESEESLKGMLDVNNQKVEANNQRNEIYREENADIQKRLVAIEQIKKTFNFGAPPKVETTEARVEMPVPASEPKVFEQPIPVTKVEEPLKETPKIELRPEPFAEKLEVKNPKITIEKDEYPEKGSTETVREILSTGESKAVQEVLDFVNADIDKAFRPEELTVDELKKMAEVLSKSSSEKVIDSVKTRFGKLAGEGFKRLFTKEDRERLKKSRAGYNGLNSLQANAELEKKGANKLLDEGEILEINQFIKRKEADPHIDERDRKALLLILKSYGESLHEADGSDKEKYGGLYGEKFKEIIELGASNMDTKKLGQALLVSDFLLAEVIPARRLKNRQEKAIV